MKRFSRYLLKFFQIPFSEKLLFIEASVLLFLAKFLLLLLPFRICIKLTRCKKCTKDEVNPVRLQKIKSAIYRANKLAFWKNVCLVQSFAGRWILNRRRITSSLSIGVAKGDEKELKAHAWLSSGEMEVVKSQPEFVKLYELTE